MTIGLAPALTTSLALLPQARLSPFRALGSFRATPYGLCTAAGLLSGMALVRSTARRAGIAPDAAWDAGLFAIFSCFVASRLLLISRDPQVFLRYPLLFLALPSLTLGGIAIAGAATWLFLRRKRLPVPRMLDVFAAPVALLGAFSELGHWLDRSEPGMPSSVPWAVREDLGGTAVRVHPVALYGVVCAVLLSLLLWRVLPRLAAGRVAALALLLIGFGSFLLSLLTQPLALPSSAWLEPEQWVALVAIALGSYLWFAAPGLRTESRSSNKAI